MTEPPEKKALSMPSVLLLMSRDDSVQILAFAAASVSVGMMMPTIRSVQYYQEDPK